MDGGVSQNADDGWGGESDDVAWEDLGAYAKTERVYIGEGGDDKGEKGKRLGRISVYGDG